MSQIGRVDAISYLIEPAEQLRDAPLEIIREHVRQQKEEILESIALAIWNNFVSTPRPIYSIEEAARETKIDAAKQFRDRFRNFHQ